MDTDELMLMAVDKAVNENSWDDIEFLFKPTNQGELLLRFDFDGFRDKVYDAFMDDAPDAMPFRFRGIYWSAWKRAIWKEDFYIKLKHVHNKRTCKKCGKIQVKDIGDYQ